MESAGCIERHWYRPSKWLTALLAPLAGLFALISGLRRCAYRRSWLDSKRVACPLVVIGNINVGGVGKTPLTLSLLRALAQKGIRAGVVSRGYGGNASEPTLVRHDSSARVVGDEPLLFAQSGVPVAIGRDRVAAAELLLSAHPRLDLILSDDGLQHYRMRRDLEITVLDGERGLGNGWLLPCGPLREPASRLETVDAVVINGEATVRLHDQLPALKPRFTMRLQPCRFYKLSDSAQTACVADFSGKRIVAMAGIGHPERFFNTLTGLGIKLSNTLVFPDHHVYGADDLPVDADIVVVTTKDAVKLQTIEHARLWVLPVEAEVTPDLADWIIEKLGISDGREIS